MNFDRIYNSDCIAGMRDFIPNETINLILADPPYVISRPSQFSTMPDRKNARTGTDFGPWDANFDNTAWLIEAARVLKKGGSLVVFNDIKKITTVIEEAENAGLIYKDTIIWNKTNPMPRNITRRYVQDIEAAMWFVKPGSKWTFNLIKKPYMSCVKRIPVESGGGFKRIHPTQKPLRLISAIVKTHSNEGDVVLDPFMGSGTTAVAAILLKRHFLGFEIDKDFFNSSVERIKNLEK